MPKVNRLTDVFAHVDMSAGPDACWPWTGALGGRLERDPRPYYSYGGKKFIAYRLVYCLFHGIDPFKLDQKTLLLHSCDNGLCCNPAHLSPGDVKQNTKDMLDRERFGLPKAVVRAIRKLLAEGRTQTAIADIYGISRETVSAIATGRQYSHVGEDDDA